MFLASVALLATLGTLGHVFCMVQCVHPRGRIAIQNSGMPYRGDESVMLPNCPPDTPEIVARCIQDLWNLAMNGFPWGGSVKGTVNSGEKNARKNLTDPLDPIKEVCDVYDRFKLCLKEHNLDDICLYFSPDQDASSMNIQFRFLCHELRRSVDLFHSLQCLQQKRVLDLIEFSIAARYGKGVLDTQMLRRKNAYYTFMDISPSVSPEMLMVDLVRSLYCMPPEVLNEYVPTIVEDACGKSTAALIATYYHYYRRIYSNLLEEIGLSTRVCDDNLRQADTTFDTRGHTELFREKISEAKNLTTLQKEFERYLQANARGTALGTVFGQAIVEFISEGSWSDFCSDFGSVPFKACHLLSDSKEEKSRFNVLQFAHEMAGLLQHGTQCNQLEIFSNCWNLLQQICGSTASAWSFSASLLTDGCQIQAAMETLTCRWQDMFYDRYLEGSRSGSLWPTVANQPRNPLYLDNGQYTYGDLVEVLPDLVSNHLESGVREIAQKCDAQVAMRIEKLFQNLAFSVYDVIKVIDHYN